MIHMRISRHFRQILPMVAGLLSVFVTPSALLAHQPWLEPPRGRSASAAGTLDLDHAVSLEDPSRASVAMYGHLSTPNEIDVYQFEPAIDDSIPVEVLVPVRSSNISFRPWVVILSPTLPPPAVQMPIPFPVPDGWRTIVIPPPEETERKIFFEPFSLERLYRGREVKIDVLRGQTYYVAVFDPAHFTGSYSLGVGSREDFTDTSMLELVGNILRVKLGLFGIERPVWIEFTGALLFIAGCLMGCLVVRLPVLGFPAIGAAFLGAVLVYQATGFSGTVTFQAIIAIPLIASTFFLHRLWAKVLVTCLWVMQLLLLLWHLLVLR